MQTLEEAKQFLRNNWEEGVECPCCHQFVKLWRHKINSQVAKCLIQIYLISTREKREWVHILNELKPSNRMYSLARWWGLIEPKEFHSEADKKASGFWKISLKGIQFVEGQIKIAKYAFLFNNKFYRFSDDLINITDAIGEKFSYRELMGEYYQNPYENKQNSSESKQQTFF